MRNALSASMAIDATERTFDRCTAVIDWLREAQRPDLLRVQRVPLDALADWRFDRSGNLTHRSGRFFSIIGCGLSTRTGAVAEWAQPMIDQPEVGVLGFLVARIGGEICFLLQRKVEPGNVNVAQASPTVQATRSNYTRVHRGASPPYLEYFFDPPPDSVIVDELQLEQASRYLGKRNRNLVVQVDAAAVPLGPDYRWTSLGELLTLARHPNGLNLDSRSVLSCLPPAWFGAVRGELADDAPFPARVMASLQREPRPRRLAAVRSWLADLAQRSDFQVRRLPLRGLAGWHYDGEVFGHESGGFFEILGVSVLHAPTREVTHWDQPLVRSRGRGVIGFLCQQRKGTLEFLARRVIEPGAPRPRIGPTVQCIPENHTTLPLFFPEVADAPRDRVRFRAIQSEEGGRFYHDERLLMAVELPPGAQIETPPEYRWLTVREIKELTRVGLVNIEARSIVACLPLSVDA